MATGSRTFSFREGDRSEYLALYLLSALGLVTQVPRQEDIGFDFVCSIADQETGRLTFNHQYVVSVKSKAYPAVQLTPSNKWDGKEPVHFSWLFRLELPFLLAVVDKDNESLSVFSTLPVWFIYYDKQYRDCASLSLVPRVDSGNAANVDRPLNKRELPKFPGRYHYDSDLGHPMLTLSTADLKNKDRIKKIKERLRFALSYANWSIMYSRIDVPYFYWFAVTAKDSSVYYPAFFCNSLPDHPDVQKHVMYEIAPILVTLAMFYKEKGETTLLENVGQLLRQAPDRAIPDLLREHLQDILK